MYKYLTLLFMSLSILTACETKPQKPEVKTAALKSKKSLDLSSKILPSEAVLAQYIQIKDAMVADDFEKTTTSLEAYIDIIGTAKEAGLTPEAMEVLDRIASLVNSMKSMDFETQRLTFIELTQALVDWQSHSPSKEKLYLQYCPMYKGGNYWLSMESQVLNPYYGSKMLRCGVVEKELN